MASFMGSINNGLRTCTVARRSRLRATLNLRLLLFKPMAPQQANLVALDRSSSGQPLNICIQLAGLLIDIYIHNLIFRLDLRAN